MKNKFITLLFVLINFTINAQIPTLQWAKDIGGTGTDQGNSVVVDKQGNVYTAGWFNGSVDFDPGNGVFSLVSIGIDAGFISKLDANGNFIWAKKIGGTDVNIPVSLKIDSGGNLIISGYYSGTSDFDPDTSAIFNKTSAGDYDIYILKLDPNGNFIWAKSVGGTGFDTPNAMDIDTANNIYLTGSFSGVVDFDPDSGITTLTCSGFEDAFILKLDSGGNFSWVKQYGGATPDYGFAIATDRNNNVYSAGIFHGQVDFDPGVGVFYLNTFSGGRIYITKLDANGNFIWAKQVGDTLGAEPWAMTIDNVGNPFIAGYFEGIADFDPGAGVYNLSSNGLEDVFILKLDSSGSFLWVRSVGGAQTDYASAMVTDISNNIYITGFFNDTVDFNPDSGIYNLSAVSYYDMFILKLNASGNFEWATNVGGNSAGTAIAIDSTSNLYFTGNFGGLANFNTPSAPLNLISNGGADAFIAKYNITTISAVVNNNINYYAVYPNPTSGLLYINFKEPENVKSIEIYNCNGSLLLRTSTISETLHFDFSTKANGIYFIRVINKDGTSNSTRIIKM